MYVHASIFMNQIILPLPPPMWCILYQGHRFHFTVPVFTTDIYLFKVLGRRLHRSHIPPHPHPHPQKEQKVYKLLIAFSQIIFSF